jgi:hypothetical protein
MADIAFLLFAVDFVHGDNYDSSKWRMGYRDADAR